MLIIIHVYSSTQVFNQEKWTQMSTERHINKAAMLFQLMLEVNLRIHQYETDKQFVVYSNNRILFSNSKEWTTDKCCSPWRAAVHGVVKSRTRLSDWTELINAATWIKCHRYTVLSDSRALTIWFRTVVAWYLGKGRIERVGVVRRKRSGCLAIFTFFFKNLEKKSETNTAKFEHIFHLNYR